MQFFFTSTVANEAISLVTTSPEKKKKKYKQSQVAQLKLGLVCLSRPGQGWHSGHYEGLILQCKETAVVRLLPIPKATIAA